MTGVDDAKDRVARALARLEQGLVRLGREQDQLRTDLTAQMDRFEDRLDSIQGRLRVWVAERG